MPSDTEQALQVVHRFEESNRRSINALEKEQEEQVRSSILALLLAIRYLCRKEFAQQDICSCRRVFCVDSQRS